MAKRKASRARSRRLKQALGMPTSTANSRLRKLILFHLVTKYKENKCYECGKVIKTVDELSIEHKLPWEGIDVNLFWSMDNIAFSHLACNKPHRYFGRPISGGLKNESSTD